MSSRRSWFILALFGLLAGVVFVIYLSASLSAGHGDLVLPLDDTYIHFQYAKQLALGQPYVYNPGQAPTSGATSFLYPYLLAIGYLIGFQGLNLGLWAMLIGAFALLASLWLVYALVRHFGGADWLAVGSALIFGLTGAVEWHFFSGMETGLVICFTLATLYAFAAQRFHGFILSASLLALIRPEASLLSLIAIVLWVADRIVGARHVVPTPNKERPARSVQWLLLIPVLAAFVQPAVNLLVTGTPVATGNSVKSIFGLVPFYWDVVLGRILDNFAQMWLQFLTGVSSREGLYIPYLIGPLALIALLWALWKGPQRRVSLLVILWLLAGTAAISTLDTAFWHFKRYQMPLIALLFPMAGWAIVMI